MRRPLALRAILAATVLLAGCATAPSASQLPSVPPSAPASTVPSTAPEVSASPAQPVEGAQLPDLPCCVGRQLDPGRYASPPFSPIWVSVEVGDGWRGLRNASEGLFTFLQGNNEIAHSTRYLTIFAIAPSQGEAYLADLRAIEALTVAAAEPITLAGLTGTRTDAVAALNPAVVGTPERLAGTVRIGPMTALTEPLVAWYTESVEARLRIYVLEATAGHVLLVYVEAPPDEFDAFAAEAEAVLATLEVAPK